MSSLIAVVDDEPDIILLDLMLPDADGLEVCKYLRRKREWASIPVIMVTAKGDETDRILGLELGADDYVTKPFSPGELVARVNAFLDRTIDVHIRNLREKLGQAAAGLIKNVRGVGYKLEE